MLEPLAAAGPTPGPRPTGTFRASHAAGTRLRIGRDEDNDMVVDDLLVSRHHAELIGTASAARSSSTSTATNGTFVNGKQSVRVCCSSSST